MKLHTLGPAETDSAAAAAQYCQTHPALQVAYHPSFEELYAHLTKYRGDQLLVPAAYQSPVGLSWGQLHYRYLAALTLVDGFLYELAPLVLAELPTRANQRAYVHPANADLLRQLIPTAEICLCPSKITAADQFLADGRYVITSQAALPAHLPLRIHQRWTVPMLWSVYLIN